MQDSNYLQRLETLTQVLNEVSVGTWRATQAMGSALGHAAAFVLNEQALDSGQGWIGKAPAGSGCSFALCAIGHACLDDRFEDLILTRKGPVYHPRSSTLEPAYGWKAVQACFDLDEATARRLFHPESYEEPSLHAVILRLTFHVYEIRQAASEPGAEIPIPAVRS